MSEKSSDSVPPPPPSEEAGAPPSKGASVPPAGDAAALQAADRKIERRIRVACVLSLAALALIVWSLVDPRPIPVVVAMTAGQAIGTLSLLFFVLSILLDLRARRIVARLGRR